MSLLELNQAKSGFEQKFPREFRFNPHLLQVIPLLASMPGVSRVIGLSLVL